MASVDSLLSVQLMRGLLSSSALDQYVSVRALRDCAAVSPRFESLAIPCQDGIDRLLNGRLVSSDPEILGVLQRLEVRDLDAHLERSPEGDRLKRYHQITAAASESAEGKIARLSAVWPDLITSFPGERSGSAGLAVHTRNSVEHFIEELSPRSEDLPIPRLSIREGESLVFEEECPSAESQRRIHELGLRLFGTPLTLADLQAAFHIDLPGYRVGPLEMRTSDDGLELRVGVISEKDGEIGHSARIIPRRPEQERFWIARGSGFHIDDPQWHRQGIGRLRTRRELAFLKRLGVDALDLPMVKSGLCVFSRLGFDAPDPGALDVMKIALWEYLSAKDYETRPLDFERWVHLGHAWEISNYALYGGEAVGEDFLLDRGSEKPFSHTLRFHTYSSYEGWGFLFKERYPPEWEDLSETTRSALVSYQRTFRCMHRVLTSQDVHVRQLYERLNNWITGLAYFFNAEGDDALGMLSPEERADMEKSVGYAVDVLSWMSREQDKGTDLGRNFWVKMSPSLRRRLPRVIHFAREYLNVSLRLPLELNEP